MVQGPPAWGPFSKFVLIDCIIRLGCFTMFGKFSCQVWFFCFAKNEQLGRFGSPSSRQPASPLNVSVSLSTGFGLLRCCGAGATHVQPQRILRDHFWVGSNLKNPNLQRTLGLDPHREIPEQLLPPPKYKTTHTHFQKYRSQTPIFTSFPLIYIPKEVTF